MVSWMRHAAAADASWLLPGGLIQSAYRQRMAAKRGFRYRPIFGFLLRYGCAFGALISTGIPISP